MKDEVATPPFAVEETPADEKKEDFKTDPVHVVRYGAIGDAVKTVIKDLYGAGYYDLRERQKSAFVRWLRTGSQDGDFKLLKGRNLFLLPEQIEAEIKAGKSVQEIKATLVEGTLDLGGVLVPEDYRNEIIKRLMGLTVVRSRARVISTVRDSVDWPKLDGGNSQYTSAVRVTWVNETPASATAASTNPTFAMERIPVHTVMARTDLSKNLLEDSAFNLLDTVAGLFAEAMAIDEDTQFLTAQGANTPLGILGARATGADESPVTGISVANTGNASQVTADGLVDLVYTLQAQYRRNAALVAAKNTHRDIRKLKDGNADYLWERGLKAGEPPSLLGYPVFEDEGMPAVAANKHPIIFGDFSGYLIVDRVGMEFARVEDVTTYGTNTVAVFARRRLGGQVIEPWKFVVQKVSA